MKRKFSKYKKIIFAVILVIFILYLNLVSPGTLPTHIIFYFLLSANLMLFFSFYFKTEKIIRFPTSIILLLILKQLSQFNLINILVILAVNILLEIYFRKDKRK